MYNERIESLKRSNRSLRAKNEKLMLLTRIAALSCGLMFVVFSAITFTCMQKYTDCKMQLASITTDYSNIKSEYEAMVANYDDVQATVTELTDISLKLDDQNKSLAKSNDEYYTELTDLRSRKELYDKYEYALVRSDGTRTDITYDQLETFEEQINDSKIDPDLYLAMVMNESNGKEKAANGGSTAKGYGQLLNGTSKFVYKDLLNKQNWSPDVALDGETNLQMTVAYVDYLYEQKGNLYDTIRSYRGKSDISSYVAGIDKYLQTKGKSVGAIANQLIRT